MRALLGDLLHHAPCSRRSRCRAQSTSAPLASGCTSCAVETLFARQEHHRGDARRRRSRRPARPRCRRWRRRRRRRSAAPSAIICLTTETSTVMPRSLNDPVCELPHCLTHRSSTPSMLAVAVGPEEVRAALVDRDDVLVVDEGHHPLLLAPHAGAVGADVAPVAVVEELHPRRRRAAAAARSMSWTDLEQVAARRAAVDDLEQAEPAGAAVDALEPGVVLAHDTPSPESSNRPIVPRGGGLAQPSPGVRRPSAGPGGLGCPDPGVGGRLHPPNRALPVRV